MSYIPGYLLYSRHEQKLILLLTSPGLLLPISVATAVTFALHCFWNVVSCNIRFSDDTATQDDTTKDDLDNDAKTPDHTMPSAAPSKPGSDTSCSDNLANTIDSFCSGCE